MIYSELMTKKFPTGKSLKSDLFFSQLKIEMIL